MSSNVFASALSVVKLGVTPARTGSAAKDLSSVA